MNDNTAGAGFLINQLQLQPHPEGGFYRRTFESQVEITRLAQQRRAATAIYYLLKSGQKSHFHRLKSDELWFFHAGSPLAIYAITPQGELHTLHLGLPAKYGNQPQLRMEAGWWFAAQCTAPDSFTLVSCVVSPGFDFADFELATRQQLLSYFPQHQQIIREFTYDN